ncbi:DUF305 domain-containing protein [Serratia sp. Ag2]|jgi:uncharacterized protein (DUF305 family)|uniref:CopM family metallochaperone n=1 Tax=Serratia sp. Ag2 TaxID=1532556 RepID=UPI000504D7E0|nr:DUF305 domain-containing protein [Serratia sp. Ag2]KFK95926.1 hypothetical protein JV45_06440 [Serratia sp. Ag2]
MNRKMLFLTMLLMSPMMVFAANQTMQMEEHSSLSPASQELMAGMMSMHDDMMMGVKSPDPDVAFAKGMIAHHQGAIKMSETQLKFGKDPEMRKLAEDIIKAQQPEIDQMQKWLKDHQK